MEFNPKRVCVGGKNIGKNVTLLIVCVSAKTHFLGCMDGRTARWHGNPCEEMKENFFVP